MLNYLIVFLLGGFPILEIRGAILYGLGMGLNPYYVLLVGALGNIIAIPIIFFALKKLNMLGLAKKLFGEKIFRKIEKNKKHLDKWGELALLLFVAIPAPMTGGWTAAFVATLLELDKKKSFVVITVGIFIAGIITLFVAQSAINGASMLIN
jgi:uncharacterized membrane protein